MFIKYIPYYRIGNDVTCSMSACLAMLLSYSGQECTAIEINEKFSSSFMSPEFRDWYNCEISEERKELGEMTACVEFMMNRVFKKIKGGVYKTDVPKIRLAFIKRDIPVIVTCQFPVHGGRISSSILIKGWEDEYLIVNDPRGNALSMYTDKLGENLLYPMEFIEKHVNKVSWNEVAVIRILSSTL